MKLYKKTAATLNYLAQDRPDLAWASHALSRRMSCPNAEDMKLAKTTMRYLASHPAMETIYVWQQQEKQANVYTDSDWATCPRTRRSVTGCAVMRGRHLIAHITRLQPVVSTSSGEAELVAACVGMTELVLLENLGADLGIELKGTLCVDARACRGIILRKGAGKVKHLSVRWLWIQGAVRTRKTEVVHIPRHKNVADAFTHAVSASELSRLIHQLGGRFIA